jgi:hypothetical protein
MKLTPDILGVSAVKRNANANAHMVVPRMTSISIGLERIRGSLIPFVD